MSIVRNTVVLRNAALGALVVQLVLALFECNGFVAVRFGIKGVFCKENRSNTLRTNRVHGPRPCTRHVHGRLHGPFTAVYTAVYTRIRVHRRDKAVYAPYTRPCTRPVVYMAGRPTRPCTRSQTARYGRVRPVTTVYTARSQPIHGSVYGPAA